MSESKKYKRFLILLILVPYGLYFGIEYPRLLNTPISTQPWVTWAENPTTEVIISWETESPTKGIVIYNKVNESTVQLEVPILESTTIHHCNLTALTPNQKYEYKIVNEAARTEIYGSGSFLTAPNDTQTTFKWISSSDTQQPIFTEGGFKRWIRAIQDRNAAFFSLSGDFVENGNNKNLYHNFFHNAEPATISTPFVPVLGNHDDFHSSSSWFPRYFVNHQNRSKFYYSFNYSMVHFTVCQFLGGESDFIAEQMSWLEADLQRSQNMTFRVAMFHCPILGNGFFGKNNRLATRLYPLLEKYNVKLLITGHEHSYQRVLLGNITQIVIGTAGGALDPGLRVYPECQFATVSPVFMEVTANTTTLDLRTYSLEGSLLDQTYLKGGNN